LEQRLSIAREQEQAAVATRQQLEAQIAKLRREVLFSPDRVKACVDVLANTVTGMKTQQDALANTLGHPPIDEGPNPTNTEVRTARTPT
jgi:N-acetylglutamate synthase/N-acetylornithine aminotransferase